MGHEALPARRTFGHFWNELISREGTETVQLCTILPVETVPVATAQVDAEPVPVAGVAYSAMYALVRSIMYPSTNSAMLDDLGLACISTILVLRVCSAGR